MHLDELTERIIHTAVTIHREVGPGMLESVYEAVLAHALERRGLTVERQKSIALRYQDLVIPGAFRADLLVAGAVIIEVKSVERLAPVHSKQVLSYLRLSGLSVGLLLNFGAPLLRHGLKRIVNNLPPGDSNLLVNRRGSAGSGQAAVVLASGTPLRPMGP